MALGIPMREAFPMYEDAFLGLNAVVDTINATMPVSLQA